MTEGIQIGSQEPIPAVAAKTRRSKRHMLSRLPMDWRERIFESIHSPALKAAVAVLTATGCRPSELERGILVSLKGDQLRIRISGSKVDEQVRRGQPKRALEIDTSTPWGIYLHKQVKESKEEALVVRYDAAGVSQRLREKSREIWPRRKDLVSAYTYRHWIGKSMKESGESPEMIAQTLGHATDFSQTCYGRAGGGRKAAGLHGIIRAAATNPVRHSPKTDRLARFMQTDPLQRRAQE